AVAAGPVAAVGAGAAGRAGHERPAAPVAAAAAQRLVRLDEAVDQLQRPRQVEKAAPLPRRAEPAGRAGDARAAEDAVASVEARRDVVLHLHASQRDLPAVVQQPAAATGDDP